MIHKLVIEVRIIVRCCLSYNTLSALTKCFYSR